MFEQVPDLDGVPGDGEAGEALLAFDPGTQRLVSSDAAAYDLFGPVVGRGVRAEDVLPELADLTPRRFVTRFARGVRARELSVRLTAIDGARQRGSLIVAVVRELPGVARNGHAGPHAALASLPPRERLESLWALVVRGGLSGAGHIAAILREAVRGLGLETGSLARVDGDELAVEYVDADNVAAATRVPLTQTFARAGLQRAGSFACLDTALDPEFSHDAAARSFLTWAFRVGALQWAVTFSSSHPRSAPFDEDDWHYVDVVVEGLTRALERREADARIEQLAFSDTLTTLPNRAAVLARIDEALLEADRSGGRAAVLFLDIDGFKSVNDTVGHRAGDVVLAEVAQRLRGTIRRGEFIGRLGGDEFAIVMPRLGDRTDIESVAQRIGGVLTFPFTAETFRFSLSASIGVAVYPDDARSRDDLLASADEAMYAAKDQGGSRVRFWERDIPGATDVHDEARDIGYLLTYQPIMAIPTGRVDGAEALIRRIHPLHGLLAPERGWSIARDENGRRALDRWVLREAVSQAKAWHRAGSELRVDVNLAAFDPDEIRRLAADENVGMAVDKLRVELSSQQFDGKGAQDAFVEACVACGVRFVLDGFDGRLCALSALSHLPIDAVKLDRSLVETVVSSSTARAVIEGTVIVARSLGWTVIAKGVENAAQHEAVVALGCDAIQGYHVATPMTALDFGSWLRSRGGQDGSG